MPEHTLEAATFDDLELAEAVRQGVREAGFSECTPIQARVLPLALAGHDVAGQAQTGTGKTAAFLIAIFDRLLRHPVPEGRRPNQPRAFILAPTRELAVQIHRDAELLGRHTGLGLGLAYGGTDYEKQRRQLSEGCDILIGTPGRLIDYFKQKVFDLRMVQVMVVDEADRMFDLGFIRDLRYLFRRMPAPDKRLSMLFSATLSYRVMELAYEHMNNPEMVKTEAEQITAENVEERVYYPSNPEKIPLLLGVLQHNHPHRAIIFTNTKHAAEQVEGYLRGNGYKVGLLSGDVPQKKRQRLISQLEAGEFAILVATDVASRGLHIPDVSHIINYQLPQSPEDYVHRIGRTARAGAEGEAISFACEDTAFYLPEIEAYIGHKIPADSVTEDLLIEPKPRARPERKPRPAGDKARGKPGQSNRGKRPEGRGSKQRPRPSGSEAGSQAEGKQSQNQDAGQKASASDAGTEAQGEGAASTKKGRRRRPRRRKPSTESSS